jgi:hypothetical protein
MYAAIRRAWKPGDRIEIVFDMRCRIISAPHGSNRAGDKHVALIRGPVVLARDQNIDAAFDQPVTIASRNGYVELVPELPTTGARLQFRVPLAGGGTIPVVDYASVNNWDGSLVCTWIPYP